MTPVDYIVLVASFVIMVGPGIFIGGAYKSQQPEIQKLIRRRKANKK